MSTLTQDPPAGPPTEAKPAPRRTVVETVRTLLDRSKTELAAAAGKAMSPDRIARIALTELRQNEELQKCDPVSFVGAVMQAAQLGLEIGRTLGEAYLVPRWNSRRSQLEVHFQAGYRGLLKLARNSGELGTFAAHVVYAGDSFDFAYGSKPFLTHRPTLAEDRGERIAAYAVAHLTNGLFQFIVVPKADIDRIKAFVAEQTRDKKLKDSSPWVKWEDAMWKKTAAKQLVPWLPASDTLRTAAMLDDMDEAGVEQNLGDLVPAEPGVARRSEPRDEIPAELVDAIYEGFETLGLRNAERTVKLKEYKGRETELLAWLQAEQARRAEPAPETSPISMDVPTAALPAATEPARVETPKRKAAEVVPIKPAPPAPAPNPFEF